MLLLVLGWLGLAIVRYRGRPGDPEPAQVEGNRNLEIAWTVTPALLLAIFFALYLRTMSTVNAAPANALRVQVIGHQWWWEYRYPDLGVVTANELHLPVGEPAVLELGAADVIHSFWVPAFGWKRDAVPGRTNLLPAQLERAGTFEGACAEYCGAQHAWMRPSVVAQPKAEFDAWVSAQRADAAPSTSRGAQLFQANTCVSCHRVRGTGANGDVAPDLTHVGSRAAIGGGVLQNSRENLRAWVRDAHAVKPGVLMPPYPNFSDDDLAALADYLWGLK